MPPPARRRPPRSRRRSKQKFPGAAVGAITKSPYFGLFEVQFDNQIVYTDAKAKYVLVGAVYDAESQGQPDRGAACAS